MRDSLRGQTRKVASPKILWKHPKAVRTLMLLMLSVSWYVPVMDGVKDAEYVPSELSMIVVSPFTLFSRNSEN